MFYRAPNQLEMFSGYIDGNLGFLLCVIRNLQIIESDCPMLVEFLCALPLCSCEFFIGYRALIVRESSGDIVAAHPQQYLSFLYFIAQPRFDLHYTARRQRDNRNRPSNVRGDCPGHHQLCRSLACLRRNERVLGWILDCPTGHVDVLHDLGRWGASLAASACFSLHAVKLTRDTPSTVDNKIRTALCFIASLSPQFCLAKIEQFRPCWEIAASGFRSA